MKKFTFLFLVLFAFSLQAQVKWMSLEEAFAAQKNAPRKIFIDFYTDWCAPCKIMDKNTYTNTVISEYLNDYYYPVKFNAEGKDAVTAFGRSFGNDGYTKSAKKNTMHEFTKYMNVNAVPSAVLLDEIGDPITILQGALTAKELEPYVFLIATDEYKKVQNREQWENFQKKFKSKIRD